MIRSLATCGFVPGVGPVGAGVQPLAVRDHRPRRVSRVKPAQVRCYVNADILGLGRILAGLRSDVTFPGDPGTVLFKKHRPPCVVTTPATPDRVRFRWRDPKPESLVSRRFAGCRVRSRANGATHQDRVAKPAPPALPALTSPTHPVKIR